MPNRTIRLLGNTYSTELYDPEIDSVEIIMTVTFNNVEVFNGPLTVTDPDIFELDHEILCTWEFDTEIVGIIPLVIEISGPGRVSFYSLQGNYTGVQNFEIDAENRHLILTSSTADEFDQICDVNEDTDGKLNVKINEEEVLRETTPDMQGTWSYDIIEDGKLECDIFIDPNRTVDANPIGEVGEIYVAHVDASDPSIVYSFKDIYSNPKIPLRIAAPEGDYCTGCKYLRGVNTCNFGFTPTVGDSGPPTKDPLCAAIPLET